jgi:hypothetical protein
MDLVMLVAESVLLLALLVVCCFVPGFFFVRWFRWTPMEKLCGSLGLSLIILYLVTWVTFVTGNGTNVRISTVPFAVTSALCSLLGIAVWKDVCRLLHSFRVRQSLLGYAFLFVWTLLILSMIRVYSGAGWYGDWLEHFQRTLFFYWRLPSDTRFGLMYALPARPPLMNVVTAYFLGQTDDRFELFQLASAFLNLLIFFPCCLILPLVAGPRRTYIIPLVGLFALNPVFMQNTTYPWTKALAAFFVVLGLAFYLVAWRKCDRMRMVAAFLALAAGSLVHYSAGLYLAFLTLHYCFLLFWKRTKKWRELATIFVLCGILLSTWFAWSWRVYEKATFLSNTSVTASQAYEGNNVTKALANMYDSIVPVLVRNQALLKNFEQSNRIVTLREKAFLFYQTNLVFGMGLIGGPAILYLLWGRFRNRRRTGKGEGWFWLAFILFCVVGGTGVVGERDELGVAHLTLLSLQILGLTLLASEMSRSHALTYLVLLGCLVDFSLGILLHVHVEAMENDSGKVVYRDVEFANSTIDIPRPEHGELTEGIWKNWFTKHRILLYDRWLHELPKRYANDPVFQAGWSAPHDEFLRQREEYETAWGGWYSRHDGEVEYIGDHVVGRIGENLPTVFLVALTLGLVAMLLKRCHSLGMAH